MWRIALIFFTILTAVSGVVLFWQWDTFSEGSKYSNETSVVRAKQKLTIEWNNKGLRVTQKIEGLEKGKEYTLQIPRSIFRFTCIKDNKKSCDSSDEDPTTFLSTNGKLQFQYTIPRKKANQVLYLAKDWTVKMEDISIVESNIDIVDSVYRKGSWVTGISYIGKRKQKYIDYTAFKGNLPEPSIYWQNSSLKKTSGPPSITFFYDKNVKRRVNNLPNLSKFSAIPEISIVFTKMYKESMGNGLILVDSGIRDVELERKIISYVFFQRISSKDKWLNEVLTAILMDEKGSTQKARKVVRELESKFTMEELAIFASKVVKQKQFHAGDLDKILSGVKGRSTHFFSLNRNSAFIPLYYYDPRIVVINGKATKNLEIVEREERSLYPFVPTMTALGYTVKVEGNGEQYILTKGNNEYIFYRSKRVFEYNNNDFGLLVIPLIPFHGNMYMEKKALMSIFKITFEENAESIMLTL